MRIKETKVYQFEELTEDVQGKVLDKCRYWNVEYVDWWDCIYEDAKRIGKILGIQIDRIYFSGFSSQGDGACFEGYYTYGTESIKKIMEYAPQDEELHRIARGLADVQRRSFYGLSAKVKQSGHYMHANSTRIDVERADGGYADAEIADGIAEYLRDFMQWIYRTLEQEYEYLTTDEAVKESIIANEVEFDESGVIA